MKETIPRYLPEVPFPPYAFIPGKNPHPEKAGGHMEDEEVIVLPLQEDNYRENKAYLFGLDLFNYGYFWESHVWWEALWHEAGRKGEVADFLKGLIKLSACGVKVELKQTDVSQGHFDRALELFIPLAKNHETLFGIKLGALIQKLKTWDKDFRDFKIILS